MVEEVAQELGGLHVLVRQVPEQFQWRGGPIVMDAEDLTTLGGELLVEDLAAGTDSALEQVAGFLVEGHFLGKS